MTRSWIHIATWSLITLALAGAAPSSQTTGPADSAAAAKLRSDLLDLMGDGNATRTQVSDVLTILEGKRQLVIVGLAGKRARAQLLKMTVDDLQDEIEKTIREDSSIIALNKALASLQRQVEMAEKAGSSPMDIAARLTDVSHQTMLISERTEAIRGRVRGGALVHLIEAQINTDADVTDLDAQLKSVDSQIAKFHTLQSAEFPKRP